MASEVKQLCGGSSSGPCSSVKGEELTNKALTIATDAPYTVLNAIPLFQGGNFAHSATVPMLYALRATHGWLPTGYTQSMLARLPMGVLRPPLCSLLIAQRRYIKLHICIYSYGINICILYYVYIHINTQKGGHR